MASLSPSPSPSPSPSNKPVLLLPAGQPASSAVSEARIPLEDVRTDNPSGSHNENEGNDAEEDGDDDDDEPKLKYSRLTKSLGGVYRNGDAVSCTWVGGDKMVRFYPLYKAQQKQPPIPPLFSSRQGMGHRVLHCRINVELLG